MKARSIMILYFVGEGIFMALVLLAICVCTTPAQSLNSTQPMTSKMSPVTTVIEKDVKYDVRTLDIDNKFSLKVFLQSNLSEQSVNLLLQTKLWDPDSELLGKAFDACEARKCKVIEIRIVEKEVDKVRTGIANLGKIIQVGVYVPLPKPEPNKLPANESRARQ